MNSILTKAVPGITTMIRMDHTHVLSNFHKYRADLPSAKKRALVDLICTALEIHAQLEEEIFYPAMRAARAEDSVLDKSIPEHDEMRRLIGVLREMDPDNTAFDNTLMELMRDVIHHVADEETTLLPDAERLLHNELGELGVRMTKRRIELAGPRMGQIARDMVQSKPLGTLLLAAGALIAGSYIATRASRRVPSIRA